MGQIGMLFALPVGNHLWNLPSQHRGLIRKIIVTTEYACLAIALVSILLKNNVKQSQRVDSRHAELDKHIRHTYALILHAQGLLCTWALYIGIVQMTAVQTVFPNKASAERFTREVFSKKTFIFSTLQYCMLCNVCLSSQKSDLRIIQRLYYHCLTVP